MNRTVSIDGQIVANEQAKVSVLDHGLLYGDGLFEGIRVRAGRVFRIEQHMARLQVGARVLGLELPFDPQRMALVVTDTVRAFARKEAYVRLLVTRGEGPLGVDPTTCKKPTVICIAAEIALYSAEQRAQGLTLLTSSYRRPNPDAQDVAVKTLNYLGSALAKQEARQRGADEALLLNQSGRVAEASVANVFVLRGRALSTPPTIDGCRRGVLDWLGCGRGGCAQPGWASDWPRPNGRGHARPRAPSSRVGRDRRPGHRGLNAQRGCRQGSPVLLFGHDGVKGPFVGPMVDRKVGGRRSSPRDYLAD
jgi:branched-subunit amino acid aminotransferase/4-amino-4-deoxychorismate lyase